MTPGGRHLRALLCLLPGLLLLTAFDAGADPQDDARQEFRNRRAALGAGIDEGTLVLLGPPAPGVRAVPPEPNFFYLTGLTEPDCALVVTVSRPASTERARRVVDTAREIERSVTALRALLRRAASPLLFAGTSPLLAQAEQAVPLARAAVSEERGPAAIEARLYLRPASKSRERWDGPGLSPGPAAAGETGIEDTRPIDQLLPDLRRLPARAPLFVLDPPAPPPAPLAALLIERPDLELAGARRTIAAIRAVKSAFEIDRIRRACDLTAAGLLQAMRSCRPGMAEYELQAMLEYVCRRGGATRQAFDSIVASGQNGTVLHYRRNDRTIESDDLVLMDVGAEVAGYAADITRTFPASGVFSPEQAKIYDVVLAAQQAAIAAVRPGARLAEVNAAAREVIGAAGLEDGWMHATSHHVGLEVHDPGSGGPLRPGMVVTVEPGLYFPETGIGIRIEDTVVVTADGCEVLSVKVPKERAEIETIMSCGRLNEERDR